MGCMKQETQLRHLAVCFFSHKFGTHMYEILIFTEAFSNLKSVISLEDKFLGGSCQVYGGVLLMESARRGFFIYR